MKLEINPRGNGACPLCIRIDDCSIREILKGSVSGISDPEDQGMEIALYTCPSFVEGDAR
ncbi:MAG: hypothetical protein ACOYM2_17485 [Rectinemataceae bacterium]